MKNTKTFGVLLLLLLCSFTSTFGQRNKIKVACLGNSITYGALIANREQNSYPAQLQAYLGEDYEVKNFGVSGCTLLSKGDYPYMGTTTFAQSKEFLPDIVIIKLGTNDTKPQNWKYKKEFKADYQKLINSFKELESNPRIVLLTPIRCFLLDEESINARLISTEIRAMIEDLAYDNQLEIINMFNLFGDQWQEHLMPDRLHPSAIGAGVMATQIGDYLMAKYKDSKTSSLDFIQPTQAFNFHGFQGVDFKLNKVNCKIVKPYQTAIGKPWVIRARFWGHEPQTDIALLEQGFHIVYCDVADMYGSNKAIARWNRLYKFMTKNGFNPKVVLEGMSRGGLIVYNWAAQNTDKVACIYADAPVMDIKSWPMGKGASEGSSTDIRRLLKAYKFSKESKAYKWHKNPLDHAEQIALAQIPCLHVVGDADNVVPVEENTAIFEKKMEELGHPITVIHKAGIGHHPHSLNNPKPIVQFILSAVKMHSNECIHAVPGNEYRSGAGWVGQMEWHGVANDIKKTLDNKNLKVLFLGNSIMQGCGGTRQAVTYKPGKAAIDSALGEGVWETAGISGDRTQNLLWRIRHDNYNRCTPQNIVIAIGINNLLSGNNSAEDVADGIIAVVEESEKAFPQSKIIVLGLLPSGKEKESSIRLQCNSIHKLLNEHSFTKAQYINPTAWFLADDGSIKDDLYLNDYIHLTTKGYHTLIAQLNKILNQKP